MESTRHPLQHPLATSGAILVATALVIVIMPMVLNSLWTKVLTSTAIFSLAALGVSLLYARLGLVNLCQMALVGIGGWIVLRLNHGTELPFTVQLLIAGFGTSVIGAVLALPALRLRGLYLALATLMVAGGLQIMFNTFTFPNGGSGFFGVTSRSASGIQRPALAGSDVAYLRYVLIVVTLGFVVVALHARNAPGRAWSMIRCSEANAMAAGVHVTKYKLWAFALSGWLAGTAGGLLAGSLKRLDVRAFVIGESIMLFCLSIVGGVFHWSGAIIAGALYKLMPALFNDIGLGVDLTIIVFGFAMLHAITTAPMGISGQLSNVASMVISRITQSRRQSSKSPGGA